MSEDLRKTKYQKSVLVAIAHYFKVFYGYAGWKMLILCLVIFLSGVFEGLGLSLLLPILNFDDPAMMQNQYSVLVYGFLNNIGVGVSLFSLLSLMTLVFLVKGLFMFLKGAVIMLITTNIAKEHRLNLCRKYSEMKYDYYTNSTIGYLNNAVTTEVDRAVSGFSKYAEVITIGVYIAIYYSVAFFLNWQVAISVLAGCLVLFSLLRRLSDIARDLSLLVSEKNAQIQSLLIQMIYHFKYLKATNTFEPIYRQLAQRVEQHRRYQFKNGVLAFVPSSMLEVTTILFLSILILFYVNVLGRPMSEIFVLLLFFYRAFSRVFGFQINWHKFSASVGGVEAIKNILHGLEANKERRGETKVAALREGITMDNVDFRYGTKPVLEGINISIPRNKTIGIVGESGSGKTTLFDIMTDLLIPQEGAVRFDGIDYCDIDSYSLRQKIGYVTQEPVIFNDSIANNITFWDQEHPEAERMRRLKDVAQRAHCVEFIEKAEEGYNTVIGDKGVKLSVGQRQRIAIARELFKDPEIMIFDEATSALDTESERFIQESIVSMLGKRTMVIVAHRLSTVRNCDQIYVLSKGRIAENGSFDELYGDTNSVFHKMCKMQNI